MELLEQEVGEGSLQIANPEMTWMNNKTDSLRNPGRRLRAETFLNASPCNSHVAGSARWNVVPEAQVCGTPLTHSYCG